MVVAKGDTNFRKPSTKTSRFVCIIFCEHQQYLPGNHEDNCTEKCHVSSLEEHRKLS